MLFDCVTADLQEDKVSLPDIPLIFPILLRFLRKAKK